METSSNVNITRIILTLFVSHTDRFSSAVVRQREHQLPWSHATFFFWFALIKLPTAAEMMRTNKHAINLWRQHFQHITFPLRYQELLSFIFMTQVVVFQDRILDYFWNAPCALETARRNPPVLPDFTSCFNQKGTSRMKKMSPLCKYNFVWVREKAA